MTREGHLSPAALIHNCYTQFPPPVYYIVTVFYNAQGMSIFVIVGVVVVIAVVVVYCFFPADRVKEGEIVNSESFILHGAGK